MIDTSTHIILLWTAIVVLFGMNVALMLMLAKASDDTTKFGRLLRQHRRRVEPESEPA